MPRFDPLRRLVYNANMFAHHERLLSELRRIVSDDKDRTASLQQVADTVKNAGNYRWVGLYDVDHANGRVSNIVWSGQGALEYPTFALTKGLTSAAVAERKTINVGDVTADPRYLTAFGTTRSEIIVPIFDGSAESVVGTIDVESDNQNAFSRDVQDFLEACSDEIRSLWRPSAAKS
ncbi:MAG TPA: GAF domain-containing protein [Candidatus Acidoferrales bacterium]|nr:GAF domain-containing protein [Candidatus Acidoferrales bacterium]